QVQVLVDHQPAVRHLEDGPQLADVHHGIRAVGAGRRDGLHQIPTLLKRMANSASTRITTVIAVTTEAVVPCPRLCVLGCTRRPKWQPIRAMRMPNTTDFDMPSTRLDTRTASGSARMKNSGLMPSDRSAATMPPIRPAIVVQPLISGIAMDSAIARGITSR